MATYKKPPATIEALLEPLPKEIQTISSNVRKSIKEILPEAQEKISGGNKMAMALYSIDKPDFVICGFQPTSKMCKVFFHEWKALLENGYKLEGSGKNARHIKLRKLSDCDPEVLKEMVIIVRNELI